MSDEQIPDTAAAGDSSRGSSFSAIVTSRVATEMHGEENRAVVRFSEEHVSALIELQAKDQENTDRQSEREYSDRKHARNWGASLVLILVSMGVLAVTAIAIILIYQGLLEFLQEMSTLIVTAMGGGGIGVITGFIIGFRMGIRYANARGRQ